MPLVSIRWSGLWTPGIVGAVALLSPSGPAFAQIVPDDTLSVEPVEASEMFEASEVEAIDALTQEIEGGAMRGTNLFHSFLEFNVGEGQAVYFNPDGAIENILSRVTGENPSNIFGTLGVRTDANLWFVNPNGIVFGEDASLDLNGSFYATTAEAIPFENGAVFSAVEPNNSSLLTVSPEASFLNFLTPASGDIRSTSDLEVNPEQTLVLAGNRVTSERTLRARGGRVELTALDDLFVNQVITAIVAETGVAADGGDIEVTSIAGNIQVNNSLFAQSRTNNGNAGNGGSILVSAESGAISIGGEVNTRSRADNGNTGNGGAIDITAGSGSLTIGGDLESFSRSRSDNNNGGSAGNGGAITLSATDDILLTGAVESLSVAPSGTSQAGGAISISSTAGNVTIVGNVDARSGFSELGSGNGGTIEISAGRDLDLGLSVDSGSRAREGNAGSGGDITLSALSGTLTVPGEIDSFSRSDDADTGRGGNITLSAAGDITLGDEVEAFSRSLRGDAQDGGTVVISADSGNIQIDDKVESFSRSNSPEATPGNGGAIAISTNAGNITLGGDLNTFSFYPNTRSGNGGNLALQAPAGTIVRAPTVDSAPINTFAIGGAGLDTGAGGSVSLAARSISGLDIVTLASAGDSGAVQIRGDGPTLAVSKVSLITSGQIAIPDPIIPDGTLTVNLDDVLSQSGDTIITAAGDITLTEVEIQADANGNQPAGGVALTTPGQVTIENSQINSNANSQGDAGIIALNVGSLSLGKGALISAATSGTGDGGDISINATDTIFLGEGAQNSAPVISVEARDAGRPGNITLNAPTFVLSETAEITATATDTATNRQAGGSITLSADQMQLSGTVRVLAETQGQVPGGVLTLQPHQPDPAVDSSNPDFALTLTPGARISASTTGSGRGGSLVLRAPGSITVSGPGRLTVEALGTGNAGDIELSAQQLTLTDGVILSAFTGGDGDAGDISFVNAGKVQLIDAQVLSDTDAGGQGGNILFSELDSLSLNNSTLTVDTAGLGGDAGEIRIVNAGMVQLTDSAILSNAAAFGTGGNLILVNLAGLSLNNSTLQTDTAGLEGNAGNIFIEEVGTFFLENNSLVLTAAAAGGNAGNIDITTEFVTAIPNENNDIIANAEGGNGGEVTVTAMLISGLTERTGFSVAALRALESSDISASATGGPDLDGVLPLSDRQGTVNLFAEFIPELADLSENFLNSDTLIAGSCIVRSRTPSEGSFVVTGRSGLPLQPGDTSTFGFSTVEMQVPAAVASSDRRGLETSITEPDGIYALADGRLVLSHHCDDVHRS